MIFNLRALWVVCNIPLRHRCFQMAKQLPTPYEQDHTIPSATASLIFLHLDWKRRQTLSCLQKDIQFDWIWLGGKREGKALKPIPKQSLDTGFWLASIKEKGWSLNPDFDYASIDFISSHFMFIKGGGNCLLIKWAAVNWLQWDAQNRKKSFHCLVCHVQ